MGAREHRKQGKSGGDAKRRAGDGDDDTGAQGAGRDPRDGLDWEGLRHLLTSGKPDPGLVSGRYESALRDLHAARTGEVDGRPIDFDTRLERFDAGIVALGPAIRRELDEDPGGWVETYILPVARRERAWLQESRAKEVKRDAEAEVIALGDAIAGKGSGEVDLEGAGDEAQKAALRGAIQKVVGAADKVAGLANKALESGEDISEEMRERLDHVGARKGEYAFGLVAESLTLAASLLELTDEEFHEKLKKGLDGGPLGKIGSAAELIKVATEAVKAATMVISKAGTVVAGAFGNHAVAEEFAGAGEAAGGALGKVVAVAGMVYGLVTMLNPDSTTDERIDGAVALVTGGLELAGAAAEGASIGITYQIVKFLGAQFQSVVQSISGGYLTYAFPALAEKAEGVASALAKLAAAQILLDSETDAERKAAFQGDLDRRAGELAKANDATLRELTTPTGYHKGAAHEPGNFRAINREFETIRPLIGRTGLDDALDVAQRILAKLVWCLEHAGELFEESATGEASWGNEERRAQEAADVHTEVVSRQTPEYAGTGGES